MLRTLCITAEDMYGMVNAPQNPIDSAMPYRFPTSRAEPSLLLVPLKFHPMGLHEEHRNHKARVGLAD
jgi:hypothetical protein